MAVRSLGWLGVRTPGAEWQHFRAPDGNTYEIIRPDDTTDPPAG